MEWLITKDTDGSTIKAFLLESGRLSKRLLIKAKSAEGNILVNGTKETVRYVLREGDVLEVYLPPERPAARMAAEPVPLDIVYEDTHLLIINKPALVAAIPSRHHPTGTIANGLLYYYKQKGIEATVHVVTRLDRDTSGLMIIAKSRHCHSLLSNLQRNHLINREYTAIVHGKMDTASGTIDRPIARKPDSIVERYVSEEGQRAVTHYTVRETYSTASVVDVSLETGRTHQIRVHFSSIGHSLAGDELYGGVSTMMKRQALHCSKVSFIHPFSGQELQMTSPLPDDMIQYLKQLINS